MKQFRWKAYLFIALISASFACKSVLPENSTSTQNPPEVTYTAVQAFDGSNTPLASTVDWVSFFESSYWQEDIVNDNNGGVYVLENRAIPDASDNASVMLYLSKITSNGTKEWQISLTETDYNGSESFATDALGNVYIASSSPKTWGNPIVPYVGSGYRGFDVYITKIDKNGNVIWNTFTGESWASTISVDTQGNLYILTFDRLNTAKNSIYSLVKLDTNGNILFDTPISGLNYVVPYYLVAHPNGSIYLSGEYVDFDGNLTTDIFLARLTSDGSLEWEINIGGIESTEDIISLYGQKIQVDQNGSAYIFGISSASWGNPINPYDGGFATDSPDNIWLSGDEYFVAKINNNGELAWHTFLNNTTHLNGATLDNNGNLYISGNSNSNWGNPIKAYNPENKGDGFVAFIDTNKGSISWNLFVGEDGEDGLSEMIIMDNYLYVLGGTNKPFGNIINPSNDNGRIFIAKILLQ